MEGVHKRYGDTVALRGVELVVDAGEILALLGPNGAGKTSLVSIVAGLVKPDSGRVRIAGLDSQRGAATTQIGLAPQDLGVYPTLTVRDNLRFHGELAGMRRGVLARRIEEVAEALALEHLLGRAARELSGGEARRLHTAMSVMHRPRLLLLDEPTAGADIGMRAQLLALVRRLADDGAAVCYSTHYMAEVEQLGASVAIIDAGRIVARGPLQTLVSAHGGNAVELRFEGQPPDLAGEPYVHVDDATVRVSTADPPAVAAARILAGLGDATRRLRSVELIEPSLESVFLELTGRRFGRELNGNDGRP